MNASEPSRLWHVSDHGNIETFEPRTPPERASGVESPVVWAINTARLPNYLVPRECPRVTFHRKTTTTPADALRFNVHNNRQVIVIETSWHERLASACLWLYEFPLNGFRCMDENAGYFLSDTAVTPQSKRKIDHVLKELAAHGAELRFSDDLRAVARDVTTSSLGFSAIRLRNAS